MLACPAGETEVTQGIVGVVGPPGQVSETDREPADCSPRIGLTAY